MSFDDGKVNGNEAAYINRETKQKGQFYTPFEKIEHLAVEAHRDGDARRHLIINMGRNLGIRLEPTDYAKKEAYLQGALVGQYLESILQAIRGKAYVRREASPDERVVEKIGSIDDLIEVTLDLPIDENVQTRIYGFLEEMKDKLSSDGKIIAELRKNNSDLVNKMANRENYIRILEEEVSLKQREDIDYVIDAHMDGKIDVEDIRGNGPGPDHPL